LKNENAYAWICRTGSRQNPFVDSAFLIPYGMPSVLQSPSSLPVSRGDSNRLDASDRAAHDWYRFVLSFPPHLVRQYIERFELDSNASVLDPFCGTGTTIVECKRLGFASIGVEAHPMSHFASATKIDWSPDPDELETIAAAVAERAIDTLERDGIIDDDPNRSDSRLNRKTPRLRSCLY
jgi:SAM-dependent methyltransferase